MNKSATPRRARLFRRLARTLAFAFVVAAPTAGLAQEAPACGGRDLSQQAADHPQALSQALTARRDWLVNSQGLLWRIDKSGVAPSYLYGTVHSTDERAVALARQAADYIKGAKVVATELGGPLDKATLAELGANLLVKALDRDKDTLAAIGSPDDRAAVEKYLDARGINAELAHHIKLWFLATSTAMPLCEARRQGADLPIVDNIIAQTGKDLGVKVIGLETMEEQGDALASIDPEVAATILVGAAKEPEASDNAFATLLNYYAQKKPIESLPILDASGVMTPKEIAAEDAFGVHLLADRNRVMAERAAPLIDAGGAFIAVGAFHLAGKDGLVATLRKKGLSVTRMW